MWYAMVGCKTAWANWSEEVGGEPQDCSHALWDPWRKRWKVRLRANEYFL